MSAYAADMGICCRFFPLTSMEKSNSTILLCCRSIAKHATVDFYYRFNLIIFFFNPFLFNPHNKSSAANWHHMLHNLVRICHCRFSAAEICSISVSCVHTRQNLPVALHLLCILDPFFSTWFLNAPDLLLACASILAQNIGLK